MRFYKGKVGSKAYELSKVWRLGFHVFKTEYDLLSYHRQSYIFRLCYMRTRRGTYYIQISKDKRCYDVCGCKGGEDK